MASWLDELSEELLCFPKLIAALFIWAIEYADCTSPEGYYLPTPPLGQDMTQGPFLSGV